MGKLMDLCNNAIAGVLRGYDRLVMHGRFMQLSFAEGVQRFFTDRGVLFKHSADWVQEKTALITADVERISLAETGHRITPIPSSRIRKEDLVQERIRRQGITQGMIGAWSCVEECQSYKIRPAAGRPVLLPVKTRCKHIYIYTLHPTYGLMSLRLQTWLPFLLQIAFNGREWLGRSLEQAGISHERRHNKIISCADFPRAQAMLDDQVRRTDWRQVLNACVPTIFPSLDAVVGPEMLYSWTCWQSEWATDIIFTDVPGLHRTLESVIQQALITGTSDRIMRYFDRATNADGSLRQNANPGIVSRILRFGDGLRVRHWLDGNSVKVYSQFNLLRTETTINNPSAFKTIRASGPEKKARAMPMRKGIQDLQARAEISDAINNRTIDSLVVKEDPRIADLLTTVGKHKTVAGKKIRGLCPFDKDQPILAILARPEWAISGFSNAEIREHLRCLPQFRSKSDKQLAGYVTRELRLLRKHGLIRKYPKQRRYQLNAHGRQLTRAIQAVLASQITTLLKDVA